MANQWVTSSFESKYFAGLEEVIPLFAPSGVGSITIQIWEQQDYFGTKIKATEEPIHEFTATYSGGVLSTLSRKGDNWIIQISCGYNYISTCKVYDVDTGQELGQAVRLGRTVNYDPIGTKVGSGYAGGENVDFYYSYDRGDRVKYVGDDYGSYDPYRTNILPIKRYPDYYIVSSNGVVNLIQSKADLMRHYGRSTWKDITKRTGTEKAQKTVSAYTRNGIGRMESVYYSCFNEAGMSVKKSATECLYNGLTYGKYIVEYNMQ